MNRRLFKFLALAALCAAGALVSLSFATAAAAWGPGDLPPGWSVSHVVDVAPASPCPSAYRIQTPTTFSDPFCENSPTYQQDFDAWVNARYTAPVTTTASTQADTTATTAPVTTAVTTEPPPAQTNPTTTTTAGCDLQCQIDAINVQLVQLRSELSKLEQILESWPGIDPGILAALMSLRPPA